MDRRVIATTIILTLAGCPKPPSEPVPADTIPVDGEHAPDKPIEQPPPPVPDKVNPPDEPPPT